VGWENLLGGFVVGVLAIAGWESGKWLIRKLRARTLFGDLAGDYVVTRKHDPDRREQGTYRVTVKENVLTVTVIDPPEGETITGEITMNEQVPTAGSGHYVHGTPDRLLWGFWDVQYVKPDTLLVHSIFSDTCDKEAIEGRVWKRVA